MDILDTISETLLLPSTWEGALTDYRMAILLMVVGLVCITIAKNYVDNPKSMSYRWSVLVGVFTGLLLGAFTVLQYSVGTWSNGMIILMGAVMFALVFRPIMYANMALGITTIIFLTLYIGAQLVLPHLIDLITLLGLFLAVYFICVLVYTLLHLAESGLEFAARLLNAWPVIAGLGILCIVEAALLITGMPVLSTI